MNNEKQKSESVQKKYTVNKDSYSIIDNEKTEYNGQKFDTGNTVIKDTK
ncbi:hypothetical protein [Macrococcoides caseolyticum]|nr:hypothetical protein [Macrococcus caseolyticus]